LLLFYCCHHCCYIVSIGHLVLINATLFHHIFPPSFLQSIGNPLLLHLTSSVLQVIAISISTFPLPHSTDPLPPLSL
jgi:hypothetical protein